MLVPSPKEYLDRDTINDIIADVAPPKVFEINRDSGHILCDLVYHPSELKWSCSLRDDFPLRVADVQAYFDIALKCKEFNRGTNT